MAFDIIVPVRSVRRADADQVRVSMGKSTGKNRALELRIVIDPELVRRFGYSKGQQVNIAMGSEGSKERGQLAITPDPSGHFRFTGGGKALELRTRSLHPTLKLATAPSTLAPPVQLVAERLIVKMPDAFLALRPVDSIMGDPRPARRV